jgi:hypothetical protein
VRRAFAVSILALLLPIACSGDGEPETSTEEICRSTEDAIARMGEPDVTTQEWQTALDNALQRAMRSSDPKVRAAAEEAAASTTSSTEPGEQAATYYGRLRSLVALREACAPHVP